MSVLPESETLECTLGKPKRLDDAGTCVDAVIEKVGKDIRVALPLGLGKANRFVNALYNRAKRDSSLRLRIYTALTLERPQASSDLERRFLEPIVERVFYGVPELEYAKARRQGELPENVDVEEFFLATGTLLENTYSQQRYNSVNYTHALRRLLAADVNVVAQMIARDGENRFSLSCNPDITLDLLPALKKRRERGEKIAIVGEINDNLPFMPNDAKVSADTFDLLLNVGVDALFGPPSPRVSLVDHAIGLHAAQLVQDGGTLQIGIGALGDAAAHALLLRHKRNSVFQEVCRALHGGAGQPLVSDIGEPFADGLYGCSEMVTQGLFELVKAGVIGRAPRQHSSIVLDGGFFLGPQKFYEDLRSARPEIRKAINMTRVADVNDLYGDEEQRRRERVNARFINVAMKATALGAIVSDALEDGRVVSGVGGQYNFAAQGHELDGARSIMVLRATRQSKGKTVSNIVWNYGHTTVPRHLRDIVVTEYGIADLRGQPDCEVINRMLSICDARFQDEIIKSAKAAGKIANNYQLPETFRKNTPYRLEEALSPHVRNGNLPAFPFGTDLTDIEQQVSAALLRLKEEGAPWLRVAMTGLDSILLKGALRRLNPQLKRMRLAKTHSPKEKLLQLIFTTALRRTFAP